MGLFSFMKGDPNGLSGSEKLMMLGAMLKDVGNAGQTNNVTELTTLLQGRKKRDAAMSSLVDLVRGPLEPSQGPQLSGPAGVAQDVPLDVPLIQGINPNAPPPAINAHLPRMNVRAPSQTAYSLPQRTGKPVSYNDPRVPIIAMQAKLAGIDPSGLLDWMKNTGEERYEQGQKIRPHGGGNPDYIPKQIEGAMPEFGPGGSIRMRPIEGARQIAADTAGAVAGAQEEAKAGWDLVDVPLGGRMVKLPRAVAAPLLVKAFGDQAGGGVPADFGQTQTPGEKTYDEGAGREQVELDFTRPKAQAALSALDAKTKVVDDAIERALGMVGGPGDILYRGPNGLEWGPGMTAGVGSMLSGVPGSRSKDLKSTLETIKANIGFDELQTMRDNSPTGGALGQVAVQELEALRSTLANLDQGQSPEALKAALTRIREIRKDSAERRRAAFDATYNRPQGRPRAEQRPAPRQAGGGGGRWTREEARAELARRRGGQ